MAVAAALCAVLLPFGARADSVSGRMMGGYGRLSFTLAKNAKVGAVTTGGVLAISFGSKTDVSPAAVTAAMPGVLSAGRADPEQHQGNLIDIEAGHAFKEGAQIGRE